MTIPVLLGVSLAVFSMLHLLPVDPVDMLIMDSTTGTELWLANLTGREQTVSLPGPATGTAVLDASTFVEASRVPDMLDRHRGHWSERRRVRRDRRVVCTRQAASSQQ